MPNDEPTKAEVQAALERAIACTAKHDDGPRETVGVLRHLAALIDRMEPTGDGYLRFEGTVYNRVVGYFEF